MQGTDNSHLCAKVKLRAKYIPDEDIKVLDAFGGYGKVWNEVIKVTGRKNICRVGFDKQIRPGCIRGDNRKWMAGMNLNLFNVIDLDAYGIPFDQMQILFLNKYKGYVFFTFIQSMHGGIPIGLLSANGITKKMREQCPTIFSQIGWTLWLDWLAMNGIKKLYHVTFDRKHYGFFSLKKS